MLEVVRTVPLPIEALWPVMSDVRDWGSWLPTVRSLTPLDPERPDEVGASYDVRQPGLPRATWTLIEWSPGASFTWESRSPGVVSTGRHVLARQDDATTCVTLSIDWSGPLAGLVGTLLGRRTRDYVTREAEALEATAAARATGA